MAESGARAGQALRCWGPGAALPRCLAAPFCIAVAGLCHRIVAARPPTCHACRPRCVVPADPSFSSAEAAGDGKKAGGGSSSDSEDSEGEVKLEEFEKRELLRVGGAGWAARQGLVCAAADTVARQEGWRVWSCGAAGNQAGTAVHRWRQLAC